MNRETNNATARASEPQHGKSTLLPGLRMAPRNRRDQPTKEAYETPSTVPDSADVQGGTSK